MMYFNEWCDDNDYNQLENLLLEKNFNSEHEKEWRLISMKKEPELYADLIYGFIINEDMLKNERAQMLIELANEKKRVVKVRHLNRRTNTFEYKEL